MAVISIENTQNPRRQPVPPRKTDGAAYRYEMIDHHQERRLYADHVDDLMPGVIPAMGTGTGISFSDRLAHARLVAAVTQNAALKQARQRDTELSPYEEAVLSGDERVGDVWESVVPLVLITTDFSPHTDIPRPFSVDGDVADPSNIIWLDPTTNETYIHSLHNAGWVHLNRHVTHTP